MDWFDEQVQDQPVPKEMAKTLILFQLEGVACDGTEGRGLWTTEGVSFRVELQATQDKALKQLQDASRAKIAALRRQHLTQNIGYTRHLCVRVDAHVGGCYKLVEGEGDNLDFVYKKYGGHVWRYRVPEGMWVFSNKESMESRKSCGWMFSIARSSG